MYVFSDPIFLGGGEWKNPKKGVNFNCVYNLALQRKIQEQNKEKLYRNAYSKKNI